MLLGLLLSLPILAIAGVTCSQALMLAASANVVGAWFAAIVAFWKGHYFVPGAAFALGLGVVLLVPLVAIALSRLDEIAAIAFGRGAAPARRARRRSSPEGLCAESVDPCSGLLRAAGDAESDARCGGAARLSQFRMRGDHQQHARPGASGSRSRSTAATLGERFKFVRVDKLDGLQGRRAAARARAYRAGRRDHRHASTPIMWSTPDWLKDLVPLSPIPRVGLVQSPQDHRDGDRSLMHYVMNAEYAGFFDIGMVQRNEVNAIIMHGTMCLIRRAAMDMAGGWSSDTIVEDTDLGLGILEHGWTRPLHQPPLRPRPAARHLRGLQASSATAGPMAASRSCRSTGAASCPAPAGLTPDQKREFALGWLNWLGAESIGVVVAILNLVWVPIVAFADIAIPDRILTLPIVASFVVSAAHFLIAVPAAGAGYLRADAGRGVCRHVGAMDGGAGGGHRPDQGAPAVPAHRQRRLSRQGSDFPAFWEAVIGGLLLVGAAVLVVTNDKQVREINIFAGVLVLQSLPFLAAVAIAVLENSRLNAFTFWRETGIRTAELIGLRPVALPTARGHHPAARGGGGDRAARPREARPSTARPRRRRQGRPGLLTGREAGPYTPPSSERVAQAVEHVTFNHGVEGSSPLCAHQRNRILIENSASPTPALCRQIGRRASRTVRSRRRGFRRECWRGPRLKPQSRAWFPRPHRRASPSFRAALSGTVTIRLSVASQSEGIQMSERLETLKKARERMTEDRDAHAKVLAAPFNRENAERARAKFVELQTLIEAIDRAMLGEGKSGAC